MKTLRLVLLWVAVAAFSACSPMHASHTAAGANIPQPAVLQVSGRISIESAPLPGQNTQSGHYFMAPFSLQGNAEQGRIDLQSPTGNLLAVLRWQKGSASIEQAGKAPLLYPDLPTMLAVALGENSPSPALLFAWLQGLSSAEAGAHPDWLVDSSQFAAKGLISAERLQPLPRTKVRIKLDQTP